MDIRRSMAIDPARVDVIVNKNNAKRFLNAEIATSDPLEAPGLSVDILPIDLSELRQVRHIKVEPGSFIPEHAHEGPVFRFITKGSAVVNDETYDEGDWMIIPAGKKLLY